MFLFRFNFFRTRNPAPELRLERPQREQRRGEAARHVCERRRQVPPRVPEKPPVVGVALDDDQTRLPKFRGDGFRQRPERLRLAPREVRHEHPRPGGQVNAPTRAHGGDVGVGGRCHRVDGIHRVGDGCVRDEDGVSLHPQRYPARTPGNYQRVRQRQVARELEPGVVHHDADILCLLRSPRGLLSFIGGTLRVGKEEASRGLRVVGEEIFFPRRERFSEGVRGAFALRTSSFVPPVLGPDAEIHAVAPQRHHEEQTHLLGSRGDTALTFFRECVCSPRQLCRRAHAGF